MRRASIFLITYLCAGCITTPSELVETGDVRQVNSGMPARLAALCISRHAEDRPVNFGVIRFSEGAIPGTHELVLLERIEGGFMVFRAEPTGAGSTIRLYSPHWPKPTYDANFSDLTKGC